MYTKNSWPDDLPSTSTTRWVKSRKLRIINAIEEGRITKEQAMEAYNLSAEELSSWYRMVKTHGPDALRTTHLKQYRKEDLKDQSFQLSDHH